MTDDRGSNGGSSDDGAPDSLLPYELWTEEAFRDVAIRALAHVAAEGLPGEHHFYVTFRTDHPDCIVPQRLKARYPDEMTIVLQHKFWDLVVNEERRFVSVGLSFGGVASTLGIPFDSMTGFADPSVKWGLRFRANMPEPGRGPVLHAVEDAPAARPAPASRLAVVSDATPVPAAIPVEPPSSRSDDREEDDVEKEADAEPAPQVVSLDAFRKRRD